ncbi:MAG TPA: U32 family peptidase [Anaerovoracaceae bacterium]|nr:U32 family peptidase [Anaerovoracaceae bacterium]
MFRIPELLAPAGGMEQLRAAAENGADAVYMGGKLFNARINAANFSDAEMKEAIAYARLRGVRLYVTMNTLIRDSELAAALEYAAFLYNEGADALIVQDLGFAELIKRYIPGFPLHLSTQGTVYNPEGARAAKRLGFSRVVAAREMTLAEIREITGAKQELPEIEVFAHGALCICYSGQCQMSREIGGRSGNRGECAQPCRLPYSVYRESMSGDGRLIAGQPGNPMASRTDNALLRNAAGPYYALSPKDLRTVGHLGPLAEAGVAALKIEGRMKSPEYVAVVTGIYRKYLDLYAKYGQYKVEPEDLKDLSQIFSRGGSTEGYLFGNPGKNLMSCELSKHQGICIGKVISSNPGKAAVSAEKTGTRQRGLVTVQLEDKLSVGDGVEIRNRELPGNLVTFMMRNGKKADSAGKGELVTIGYIDGPASPGDKLYKISDKALMERARASYEAKSGSAEKTLRKSGVAFRFAAALDRPVSLKVTDENGAEVTKTLPETAEKALTKALTPETVEAQLAKTGGTPFRMTECISEIEEDVSVPLSKINELRRAVLEELESLRRQSGRIPVRIDSPLIRNAVSSGSPEPESAGEEELFLYLYRAEKEENFDPSFRRIYVPYDAMLNGLYQNDARTVPVIPNITKGWHDGHIRKNFDKIIAMAQNGIAVGNLGWIEPFAAAGASVIGDYGLNLFNSMDFLLAGRLGVREALISHEADLENILEMDFHGVTPEVIIKGRIPLMTSEHCFIRDLEPPKGADLSKGKAETGDYFLKDRKGQFYPVITDPGIGRSLILSHKETDLAGWKEALKKAGIRRFRVYLNDGVSLPLRTPVVSGK